jgi:hypothetical protein
MLFSMRSRGVIRSQPRLDLTLVRVHYCRMRRLPRGCASHA